MNKRGFRKIINQEETIFYQYIDNKSDKTVVFIHGLFSSSAIFRHFLKFIKMNVVLVELRGVVYSKCRSPYLENYINDIQLILNKEHIQKGVTLIGFSLGCTIANAFAKQFDHMVDKVILLSPINRKLKDIGRRKLVRNVISAMGKNFFKKWKEYVKRESGWSFWKVFGLFNFRLLKEACEETVFTNKCKVVIINGGKAGLFFNNKDAQLALPNIFYKEIKNLDHYLFLTKRRIKVIQKHLLPHLQTV